MKTLSGMIAAAVLMSSAAMAQYPQNGRYDGRGGYERRDSGANAISAVQFDLQRIASRGRLTNRERNRVDQALRSLNNLERDLNRGKFDRHALDKTIDRLDDVVRNLAFDGRERNTLLSDMNRLRDFRR